MHTRVQSQPHLPAQFENDIDSIKDKVMAMGGVIEKCVSDIIRALSERNHDLLPDSAAVEEQVNAYEIDIDSDCVDILARRQPMACDLRIVVSIMKITPNLERIGDEAERIVKFAKQSSLDSMPSDISMTVDNMMKKVLTIVSGSLDCFSRLDSNAAKQLFLMDKDIDREYNAAQRQLITYVMQEPKYMLHVLNVMWCARALERIGDHSKNIAEQVIFINEAVDIRHR